MQRITKEIGDNHKNNVQHTMTNNNNGETLRRGRIEVICGSMFSGKTEELIRRLRRAQFARQKVEIFKPAIDTRYSDEEVVSKCGWTPYVGRELNWHVDLTICNGNIIYSGSKGFVAPDYRGEAIVFCHDNNT